MDYRQISPMVMFVANSISAKQIQQHDFYSWEQAVAENRRGWLKLSNNCYTLSLTTDELLNAFALGAIVGWIS